MSNFNLSFKLFGIGLVLGSVGPLEWIKVKIIIGFVIVLLCLILDPSDKERTP